MRAWMEAVIQSTSKKIRSKGLEKIISCITLDGPDFILKDDILDDGDNKGLMEENKIKDNRVCCHDTSNEYK